MVSGLYKYIVFDWLERSTGRVYDEPCHRIMGHEVDLPNSDWVARNHSCVPLYTGRISTRLMRVLVTGGSGFIGSHVVDKLRARGHEPVIYDLRPSPWHEHGTVDTVLGSITDREALERALHSCDAVAHLAAVADVNDVHASPEDAERVNARGTVDGARGRAAGRGRADRLRLDDLGLLRLRARGGRRGDAAAATQPSLHQHQARRRALLQGVPGAVRDRLHDPAVWDPLRSPRPRGGGDPGVRQQGARRRATDARRRRQPVAEVRLRRGSGRRRRAAGSRTSRSTGSTTWPATRRSRSSRSPRRSRS